MQGTIVSIDVREGELVRQGQPLFVMEAMKMEHVIASTRAAWCGESRSPSATRCSRAIRSRSSSRPQFKQLRHPTRPKQSTSTVIRPDLAEVLDRQAKGARPGTSRRGRAAAQDAPAHRARERRRPLRHGLVRRVRPAGDRRAASPPHARRPDQAHPGRRHWSPASAGSTVTCSPTPAPGASRCRTTTPCSPAPRAAEPPQEGPLFECAERLRLPVVFFTEGGGGRPGDTDGLARQGSTAWRSIYWGS